MIDPLSTADAMSTIIDLQDQHRAALARITELEAFVAEIERIEREWTRQALSSPMAMLAVSNARKKV